MPTLGPSAAAKKHPDHRIDISNATGSFEVIVNGETIASTDRALALDEANYDRVIYFPPDDVRTELLQSSDSRTTCPFKGEARYYAAEIEGGNTDVAWFYPEVYDEVAPIAGYIAFYADRVELIGDSRHRN